MTNGYPFHELVVGEVITSSNLVVTSGQHGLVANQGATSVPAEPLGGPAAHGYARTADIPAPPRHPVDGAHPTLALETTGIAAFDSHDPVTEDAASTTGVSPDNFQRGSRPCQQLHSKLAVFRDVRTVANQ